MNAPEIRRPAAQFATRRRIVGAIAAAVTTALAAPALAQFSFSFGGSGDKKGSTIDLNKLFSGIESVFDGFNLDEKDELAIGTKLFPRMIDRSGGAYANRRAQGALQRFAEDLLKTSTRRDFPWEVVLVNNNTLNAWALPGGKIAVHKGLLRYTSNETELAAVISHEIGHVELSHGLAQMKTEDFTKGLTKIAQQTILNQGKSGVLNDMVLDLVEDRIMNVVTTGYSRDREFEADLHILKIFGETGHDPAKAAGFFKVLLDVIPPGTAGTTSLFSTHPGTRERIARIEDAARDMPPPQQPSRASGFAAMKKYFPNGKFYRRRG